MVFPPERSQKTEGNSVRMPQLKDILDLGISVKLDSSTKFRFCFFSRNTYLNVSKCGFGPSLN